MSANLLIIIAALCLIAEIFIFSYFLLFVGIGTLFTAFLTFLELFSFADEILPWQFASIAVFSLLSIPLIKPILKHFKPKEKYIENPHLSPKNGDNARVVENGFIECHGTLWQAETNGFKINDRVKIIGKKGELFLIELIK